MTTFGSVSGLSEELVVEWSIPQYSTLSCNEDDYYKSPVFHFLGNRWWLQFCCNEGSKLGLEGLTVIRGLCLKRENIPIPLTITCTFGLKSVGEPSVYQWKFEHDFEENDDMHLPIFFNNSHVIRDVLLPNDVLTVRCTLRSGSYKDLLLDRLHNVSRTMLGILKEEKRTDVVLKVEGKEIKAHRLILEARSEVFQKMFSHDMLENRTREVKIEDMKYDVFQRVLTYIYSGRVEVTPENAPLLYVAADRFELRELTELCSEFMIENMSDDLFCDAFVVADMYNETDLMEIVKEYLGENFASIIGTEKWKKMVAEDPVRSTEILTTFMIINVDKSKCEK